MLHKNNALLKGKGKSNNTEDPAIEKIKEKLGKYLQCLGSEMAKLTKEYRLLLNKFHNLRSRNSFDIYDAPAACKEKKLYPQLQGNESKHREKDVKYKKATMMLNTLLYDPTHLEKHFLALVQSESVHYYNTQSNEVEYKLCDPLSGLTSRYKRIVNDYKRVMESQNQQQGRIDCAVALHNQL